MFRVPCGGFLCNCCEDAGAEGHAAGFLGHGKMIGVFAEVEGAQFKVRSIKFVGGDEQSREYLRQQFLLLREGDVFVDDLFRESIKRINDTHSYDPIDADKDVNYRTDQKAPLLDLTIRLKKSVASLPNP